MMANRVFMSESLPNLVLKVASRVHRIDGRLGVWRSLTFSILAQLWSTGSLDGGYPPMGSTIVFMMRRFHLDDTDRDLAAQALRSVAAR
jgi:hypothetical protein